MDHLVRVILTVDKAHIVLQGPLTVDQTKERAFSKRSDNDVCSLVGQYMATVST